MGPGNRSRVFSPAIAALCGLVLMISPLLRLEGEDVVIRLGQLRLAVPGACLFHDLTGIECPFCGLSRGFVCAAHLELGRAMTYNWASVPALAAALLYALAGLVERLRRRRGFGPGWDRTALQASKAVMAVVLLAGWMGRVVVMSLK